MSLYTLTVADVMTVDPIVVHDDDPIERAIELLGAHRITGLPVLDRQGRLVGVVSQSDLLAVRPWMGAVLRGRPDGLRVGELMTSPAVAVPMTASLVEAARVMTEHGIHRVVTVDDDDEAVGVLSGTDFVALVAEG